MPAVRRDATRTVDIPGGCSFRAKVSAVAIRDTVTEGEREPSKTLGSAQRGDAVTPWA